MRGRVVPPEKCRSHVGLQRHREDGWGRSVCRPFGGDWVSWRDPWEPSTGGVFAVSGKNGGDAVRYAAVR